MTYIPSQGTWTTVDATGLRSARARFSPEEYEQVKANLQLLLCAYFSMGNCSTSMGETISPMGLSGRGGKILKVRCGIPGQGRSGGLRLAIVVYCQQLRVVVAEAFMRNTNPSTQDFNDAVRDL